MDTGVGIATLRDFLEYYLYKKFPHEYLSFVFDGNIKSKDVIDMVLFLLAKDAYNATSEKHSLRFYYQKCNFTESQIMQYSRQMSGYVNKYRTSEYQRRKDSHSAEGYDPIELLPPDMSDIQKKIDGYQISELNFFELKVMLEKGFSKAFTEHRIIDSKKVSGMRLEELVQEFDDTIDALHDDYCKANDKTIFSSLAAFILEWKFPINFIYSVAKAMDEKGLRDFPDMKERLVLLCGDLSAESMLGYRFSTHSRMVTIRERYIDMMLTEPSGSLRYKDEKRRYIEGLFIVSQLLNDVHTQELIKNQVFNILSDDAKCAAIMLDYDIFLNICNKERAWNNRIIKNFRKCLDAILV